VTINRLIELLEEVLGPQAHRIYADEQAGDVPVTHADTTDLETTVGFTPATAIEDGLARFASLGYSRGCWPGLLDAGVEGVRGVVSGHWRVRAGGVSARAGWAGWRAPRRGMKQRDGLWTVGGRPCVEMGCDGTA
jgi:UDP-glucuronate 4-epimerase